MSTSGVTPNLTIFEIPLKSIPQTLTVTLSGIDYDFNIDWNDTGQCWVIDISLTSTGERLLSGEPMLTGVDILGQFRYLGFTGGLIIQTDNETLADPTYDNLGTLAHLYYIPDGQ